MLAYLLLVLGGTRPSAGQIPRPLFCYGRIWCPSL